MSFYEHGSFSTPVVVLAGPLLNGELHPLDTRLRIEHGIGIYEETGSPIVTVGGCAKQMREYAVKSGVSRADVYAVGDLRDTVGNAIDIKEQVVEHLGLSAIKLVTADYHMPRALDIFETVMPDAEIDPSPSNTQYSALASFFQSIKEITVRKAGSSYFLRGYDAKKPESHIVVRSRLENFAAARNRLEKRI